MKNAASRELYDYWNRLRGDQPAPLRSAIEPSDIRRFLADTFIVEVAGPDDYNIRLAGTRLCGLYGREIKGTNLLDFWTDEDRSAMATLLAAVTDEGAAAVLTADIQSEAERTATCELLLLPLRHGPVGFDRVLGCFAPLAPEFWLGSDPVTDQRIASLRLIWPGQEALPQRRRTDNPADIRAVAASASTPTLRGRKHGHLVVVEGGKR